MSTLSVSEATRHLLRELPAIVPVARIDRIWLFRPRELGSRESGLVVLSLLGEDEPPSELRQVITIRYEAERVRGALQRRDTLAEQGWAPAERVPRVIAGVLARLSDETEVPLSESIAGDEARWTELLRSAQALPVDPDNQE